MYQIRDPKRIQIIQKITGLEDNKNSNIKREQKEKN